MLSGIGVLKTRILTDAARQISALEAFRNSLSLSSSPAYLG